MTEINFQGQAFTPNTATGKRKMLEELNVNPKEQIIVEGEVEFGHLNAYTATEFQKMLETSRAKYKPTNSENYRKLVLKNPRAISGTSNNIANYFAQYVYESKGSIFYSLDVNSPYGPHMFQATAGV